MKFPAKTLMLTAMNKAFNDLRILRGMEKQLRLRQDRLNSGEKSIGWKVGFGAPASLERLGLDAPLVGFLTDKVLVPSNTALSLAGYVKPAIEPEIAVYMGRDLSEDADRNTTRTAIASLGPAIELADIGFPPEEVESILAGNIYNRHVLLGLRDPKRAGGILDGLTGHVSRNGHIMSIPTDLQVLTGDIIDIVTHVAGLLSFFGETLCAGDLIITGSIIPPLWIDHEDEIIYQLEPIDTISIKLF
jgi:2-keto-4-pentenoate hydratase